MRSRLCSFRHYLYEDFGSPEIYELHGYPPEEIYGRKPDGSQVLFPVDLVPENAKKILL